MTTIKENPLGCTFKLEIPKSDVFHNKNKSENLPILNTKEKHKKLTKNVHIILHSYLFNILIIYFHLSSH